MRLGPRWNVVSAKSVMFLMNKKIYTEDTEVAGVILIPAFFFEGMAGGLKAKLFSG